MFGFEKIGELDWNWLEGQVEAGLFFLLLGSVYQYWKKRRVFLKMKD